MNKLKEKIKKIEKKKLNHYLKMSLLFVAIFLVVCGVTYAWYRVLVNGNDTAKSDIVETGVLKIKYTDGDKIEGNSIEPGWTETKTFTVENIGTVAAKYNINWASLTNEFVNKNDLVYTLTSTNDGGTLEESPIPETGSHVNIIEGILINPGVIQDYTITVTYKNTSEDQSSDMGKTLTGKLEVVEKFELPACNAKTIGLIIEGEICSAVSPECFECAEGKSKIQLTDGKYTCK